MNSFFFSTSDKGLKDVEMIYCLRKSLSLFEKIEIEKET